MVALHNSGNGQPVSSMRTVSAIPTAPKVVGSLLAMRLTSTANNGRNPSVTSMAAGMATEVP